MPSLLVRWLIGTAASQPAGARPFDLCPTLLGGVLSVGCFSLVLTDFQAVELSTDHWKAILYLGCVASGLGFFLWNKGCICYKSWNSGRIQQCSESRSPWSFPFFFLGKQTIWIPKVCPISPRSRTDWNRSFSRAKDN